MGFRQTVVLDFDGVVNSYTSGWKGIDIIPDPPVNGIREAIEEIRKRYRVVIVSTRCHQEGGVDAIKGWLIKYNITVDDVTMHKPPAKVYVDDRAITFDGDAQSLLQKIDTFKPWHKQ